MSRASSLNATAVLSDCLKGIGGRPVGPVGANRAESARHSHGQREIPPPFRIILREQVCQVLDVGHSTQCPRFDLEASAGPGSPNALPYVELSHASNSHADEHYSCEAGTPELLHQNFRLEGTTV